MQDNQVLGNQQAKVTDQEYGWVCGLWDGEGSVFLSLKSARGKSTVVTPGVSIANTEVKLLTVLTEILDRAGLAYHVAWSQPKGRMKDGRPFKQAWVLRAEGHKRCKRFAQWLAPGLVGKQERALLLLRYIALREQHGPPLPGHKSPLTEEELGVALEMRRMNQKGKGTPSAERRLLLASQTTR